MFKMIFLLAGLAVGFGGGVYWGVHHPTEAKNLADTEERKAVEYQIAVTQGVKQKLDEIISKKAASTTAAPPAGASGFVSGGGGTRRVGAVDPDLMQARNEQDQQIQQLQQKLASMPKK